MFVIEGLGDGEPEDGSPSPVCAAKPGFPGQPICLSPGASDPLALRPASIPKDHSSPSGLPSHLRPEQTPYSGALNFPQPRTSGPPPAQFHVPGSHQPQGLEHRSPRAVDSPTGDRPLLATSRPPQSRAHLNPAAAPAAPPAPRALPGAGPARRGVVCADVGVACQMWAWSRREGAGGLCGFGGFRACEGVQKPLCLGHERLLYSLW